MRPSFYHRAQDLIAYNTLPSYIKSRTTHLTDCVDLCKALHIQPQEFVNFVPSLIANYDFSNYKP